MKTALLAVLTFALSFSAWAQAPITITNNGSGTPTAVLGNVTIGGASGGASLVSISVAPPTTSVSIGGIVTYSALGTFSDSSTADLTAIAVWSLNPPGIATNAANVVTCAAQGTVSVMASVAGITGTASLTCFSYQIVPSGVLTAYQNTPYAQPFTELGGTGPYTWSTVGTLPTGLSMSPTGTLSGTPTVLGSSTFTVKNTDSSGPPFTDSTSVTVNVLPAQAEDNTYCTSGEAVTGLFADATAQPMQNCNYTAVAGSPTGSAGIRYVCPTGQRSSTNDPIPGCANAESVTYPNYFNAIQDAMAGCGIGGTTPSCSGGAASIQPAPCGTWIQLYETTPELPSGVQNRYDESLVLPPTSCFGDPAGWPWVSTKAYSSLPPPGTRITPAWAGQTSVPGRPPYAQPSAAGIYVPFIRCHDTGNECAGLKTPKSSAGGSGWRFVGLEFAGPHGRESVCPNNFNGTPQCSPGWSSPMVSIGCSQYSIATCGATGVNHVILDRIIVHACDDKSDLLCKDQAVDGVEMQGGQHLSIVDSYIYGFKTLTNGIGPSVESHGIIGGNVKNTTDDIGFKSVNNFIEASSVDWFMGGGNSATGLYPYDLEFRRNTLWKPLLWKVNDPSFPQFGGSVFDAWVTTKGSGYANGNPGAACTIDAPGGSGTTRQATCHTIVSGGQLLDVIIDDPGLGYIDNAHFTIAGGDGKAKALPIMGILSIKNHFEFKHGRRALIEGNTAFNCWKGQSDQDCNVFLLTPKNANNGCQTCTVQDITMRFNYFRGSNRGGFIGTDTATRCSGGGVCLPDVVRGISIHDDVWDDINPGKWISKAGAFDGFGGTVFGFNNANPQNKAVQDVVINHITAPMTVTGGRASADASAVNINGNCKQTSAVLAGITYMNSIAAGGFKATGQLSNGCFQCIGSGCSGGTQTVLDGMLINDNLLPVGGGNYTTNQVMHGIVTAGGTWSVAPSACTFNGGGFSVQATCGFRFSGGTITAVFPVTVGAGYTSAPTVSFTGGTFSVAAVVSTEIGGAGIAQTKAWCNDHNLYPTAAFSGEVPMTPYPTAQGDPTNNSCSSHGGGGNLTVTDWPAVKFVNFPVDGAGVEIPGGDLHLAGASPGKGTANDGKDIGADIDLVNQYTRCFISGGLTTCP